MVCKHCKSVIEDCYKKCPNCGRKIEKIPDVIDHRTAWIYNHLRHRFSLVGLVFGIALIAAVFIPELANPVSLGYKGVVEFNESSKFFRVFFTAFTSGTLIFEFLNLRFGRSVQERVWSKWNDIILFGNLGFYLILFVALAAFHLLTATLTPRLDIQFLPVLIIQLIYFHFDLKMRKKILTFKEYAKEEEARVKNKYYGEE